MSRQFGKSKQNQRLAENKAKKAANKAGRGGMSHSQFCEVNRGKKKDL